MELNRNYSLHCYKILVIIKAKLITQRGSILRKVFYISDGTAITAEVLGHAVLSQFDIKFEQITIPFVETLEKANEVALNKHLPVLDSLAPLLKSYLTIL